VGGLDDEHAHAAMGVGYAPEAILGER
jgi:hypothetical protein